MSDAENQPLEQEASAEALAPEESALAPEAEGTTESEGSAAEGSAEVTGEASEEAQPKAGSTFQEEITPERFNYVYGQKKQGDRENAELKERLAKYEAQENETPEPKLEDFAYDQEYIDAKVEWQMNQNQAAKAKEDGELATQQQQQQQYQELATQHFSRVEDYAKENPEYIALNNSADKSGFQFDSHIADIIVSSPNSPKLHHYMLKNLGSEKVEQILNAPIAQAGYLMAQLEQSLPAKEVSKAPAPPTTVSDTDGGNADPNSFEELEKTLGY